MDQDRCSPIMEVNVGNPLGVCEEAPNPLQKVTGGSLYEMTYHDTSIHPALISPGYETLQQFQMTGPEMGQLFQYWFAQPDNPRGAVCDWVIDNYDYLQTWIPRTYPRIIVENPNRLVEPLTLVALVLSSVSLFFVVLTAIETTRRQHCKVMRYAQLDFLWILIVGLGLVSLGSILLSLPPTDGLCVAMAWFTNVGYTLELVPLIVKGAAIYRLMAAAKRLRHIVLNRKKLFGVVFFLSGIVVVFLIVWTAVDPPRKQAEYDVMSSDGQLTEEGETVVFRTLFCISESNRWGYTSVGWHLTMLVIATVQTFQTRSIRKEINESQTLTLMIYSHFMFVCLRLVSLFLEDQSLSEADMMHVQSIIYSLDCTATIVIYFVPKFAASREEGSQTDTNDVIQDNDGDMLDDRQSSESQTVKQLRLLAAVATARYKEQQQKPQESAHGFGSLSQSRSRRRRSSLTTKDLEAATAKKNSFYMNPALVQSVTALGIEPEAFTKSMEDYGRDFLHNCDHDDMDDNDGGHDLEDTSMPSEEGMSR